MTGLLVSVRDETEARMALAAGVDLIDVKEPSLGSLGAASPEVWQRVLEVCGDARPVSAALGELLSENVQELAARAHGLTYAKVGLAGCAADSTWLRRWQACLDALPRDVAPVAVAYADAEQAVAPRAEQVLDHAIEFGCRALLLDTYKKKQGDLFAHLTHRQLGELVTTAHAHGLLVVLAGSIGRDAIPSVEALGADYLAVRGAVCRGPRSGAADVMLIKQLVRAIDSRSGFTSPRQDPRENCQKTF